MKRSSWQDLRDRFLDTCYDGNGEPTDRWLQTWYLLLGHSWFREQLASAAKNLLRRSGCPFQWQQDIEQEATVLLARRLRKRPSLGIDPTRAKDHFGGWMRTIITHDCRDALRKLLRAANPEFPLPDYLPASEEQVKRETRIDLSVALNQLDKKESTILLLYSKGFTLQQVAEQLNISFWTTYRTYHKGLKNLRRLL